MDIFRAKSGIADILARSLVRWIIPHFIQLEFCVRSFFLGCTQLTLKRERNSRLPVEFDTIPFEKGLFTLDFFFFDNLGISDGIHWRFTGYLLFDK